MPNNEISDMLERLFRQAQMQFGRAVNQGGCTMVMAVPAVGGKSMQ